MPKIDIPAEVNIFTISGTPALVVSICTPSPKILLFIFAFVRMENAFSLLSDYNIRTVLSSFCVMLRSSATDFIVIILPL